MDDNDGMKEDQIEIKTSRKIEIKFRSMQLGTFWCTQLTTFPRLEKISLGVLAPFATT